MISKIIRLTTKYSIFEIIELLITHLKLIPSKIKLSYVNKKIPYVYDSNGFLVRKYSSTSEYTIHQKGNIDKEIDSCEFEKRVGVFYDRFKDILDDKSINKSIICLGARDGAEVAALRKLGLLGVGLDIDYPSDSKYVHFGDIHDIPYPDSVFDMVYMNIFDHVLDPVKTLSEIHRILKPETGTFILDLPKGIEEGYQLNGYYESFVWGKRKQVEELCEKNGFKLKTIIPHKENEDWSLYLWLAKNN